MQLQSSCFAHKTDCFLTLLLSSSCVVRRASCVVRRRCLSSLISLPDGVGDWMGDQARISRREDCYFFLLYVVYFCFPCPIWLLNVDWKAYVAIFRSADEKREKRNTVHALKSGSTAGLSELNCSAGGKRAEVIVDLSRCNTNSSLE